MTANTWTTVRDYCHELVSDVKSIKKRTDNKNEEKKRYIYEKSLIQGQFSNMCLFKATL